MKLNCAIVQDLLPLYADDLCSDETTEAVRAHLAECDDCRRAYEAGTVAVTPAGRFSAVNAIGRTPETGTR